MHARFAATLPMIFLGMSGPTAAEDRANWFKSLKQPVTGVSCCDISDCRRTDADWRDGRWWAVVHGDWTPIPEGRQLDKDSIDGDAYVCASPAGYIYCFVPPLMGS